MGKKMTSILLAVLLALTLAACGNPAAVTSSAGESASAAGSTAGQSGDAASAAISGASSAPGTGDAASKEALVVYFSYSGNTEKIARMIAEDTGAELFQIETVASYPESYDAVLEVAQKEQDENARPELSGHVENMANYGVVYLGWPCWWGNCPMAVLSFLEEYDLSGKTIVPFTTHGGSSWAHSLDTVAAACPNATLLEGLSIQDSDVDGAAGDVSAWLAGLGMVR